MLHRLQLLVPWLWLGESIIIIIILLLLLLLLPPHMLVFPVCHALVPERVDICRCVLYFPRCVAPALAHIQKCIVNHPLALTSGLWLTYPNPRLLMIIETILFVRACMTEPKAEEGQGQAAANVQDLPPHKQEETIAGSVYAPPQPTQSPPQGYYAPAQPPQLPVASPMSQ